MASIADYVSVQVTRETRPIDQASFDTPLFLAAINFYGASERARVYKTLAAMAEDGFPTSHPAYLFVEAAFSQSQRPNSVVVGKQGYTAYKVVPTVANEAAYTIKVGVKGFVKTITFTSDATATATEIVDGFVAAITGDSDLSDVTATNVADELVITPDASKECIVSADTNNLAVSLNGAENITTALTSVALDNNDWFFLSGQSRLEADMLLFSAYAEANDKMYLGVGDVATIGDNGVSNDIASQLKALQYDNTHVWAQAVSELGGFEEGGLVGSIASANAGVTTLFGKTIKGASTSSFTATQETTVQDKNANFYPMVAGTGFYTDGKQASGEYFDTVRFSLWAKARVAEGIFGLMKRKSDAGVKIPYSNVGFSMIEQAIFNNMINVGVARGAILTTADGAEFNPRVNFPERSDVSVNNRAARILPDVEVEFIYSGAVQNVKVKVFVSI